MESNSPVKRSVSFQHPSSEHSTPRRQSPHGSAASEQQPHKSTMNKPHRSHVVGAQRTHGRNLSHKSLNKLQRLALTHNLAADGDGEAPTSTADGPTSTARRHQRKKSAPVSPSTSPHARRNGSHAALAGQASNAPVKRNVSTPILKRDTSSNFVKKGHPPNNPADGAKREPKKAVGFQLADSDDEDDEWEDNSSQSNGSTRRNSLAPTGKMNGEREAHHSSALTNSPLVQDDKTRDRFKPSEESQISTSQSLHAKHDGQDDMATSILHRHHASKAPPTTSSITATARRAATGRAPHQDASLVNLSSSLTAVNNLTSHTVVNPHGTSFSAEGGVSRFLPDDQLVGAQSASNPSAPSSFLPHYNPDTPPSPDVPSRRPQSPTLSRRRPAEPASRTQQKLWLQRTATLSTSPPGGPMDGLRATMDTAPVDHEYVPGHLRTGSGTHGHENRRGAMGAPGLPGRQMEDSEAKRTRKGYDRLSSELSVVQRFRSPTTDSFNRLVKVLGPDSRETSSRGRGDQRHSQTNGHISSFPAISRSHSRAFSKTRDPGTLPSNPTLTEQPKGSQVRFQDLANTGDADHHGENPDVGHHQLQSNTVPVVRPDGYIEEQQVDDSAGPHAGGAYTNGLGTSYRRYHANEEEILLRRMWESREVPIEGD